MSRGLIAIVATGLFVLIGWSAALYLATNVRSDCRSAEGAPIAAGSPGCTPTLAYQITHPTPWWGFNHVFGPLLLIALVAVPILLAAWFWVRRRRSGGRAAAEA